MLRIINGTGKCCPDCGVEVNITFDEDFDYICPECGLSIPTLKLSKTPPNWQE